MIGRHLKIIALIILLASFVSTVEAQRKKKSPAQESQATLNQRLAKAKAEVIQAANDYKASLEKLLALQEGDVKIVADEVKKREALLEQGIISRRELEEGRQKLALAQTKASETRKQIIETDTLIAEASAEEKLAKLGPARRGAYQSTAALIRYNGPSQWVLADAAKIEGFFMSRFNRGLPISALGQTSVHDRLGFDHSNSIDVAVHPDSAEGQALMAYLRSAGIPFIAFRQAVAGVATGAHIHIGHPSRRIASR